MAPAGYALQTGAVLIGEIDDGLVPRARERLGHGLENIKTALSPLPATAMDDGLLTAYGATSWNTPSSPVRRPHRMGHTTYPARTSSCSLGCVGFRS